jgi:Na+-driven multidrug efflux pump
MTREKLVASCLLLCLLLLEQCHFSVGFSASSGKRSPNVFPKAPASVSIRWKQPHSRQSQSLFASHPNEDTQQEEQEQEACLPTKLKASLKSSLPTYRRLIAFITTTSLIWLSEPLLSLVDTTIVGWTCNPAASVVQIAALGPATMLHDSCIYITYFLAIAATNQLAPALAKKNWKLVRRQTSHVMGLALGFGLAVSAIVFGLGNFLITNMVGTGTVALSEIIPLATTYARIRASVAPFGVVGMVAQSVCLASMDTVTPMLAVAVASIVNIIGDLALSPRWGIQGAAVATALATVASTMILVRKVHMTTREWKRKQEEEQFSPVVSRVVNGTIELVPNVVATSSSTTSVTISDDEAIQQRNQATTKGATQKKSNAEYIPFLSLPDRSSLLVLVKLAGPIFFVMMAKIACYSIMTLRATGFGLVPLAAHNIMVRYLF